MADPTEDIPADRPLGQGDGDFEFRALGPGVTGAAGVGAVVELADQLDRTVQGVDATVSVVTDIHPASTDGAVAVEDVEFPESEVGIRGPGVRHPENLHAAARSIDEAVRQELTVRTDAFLALSRIVEKKGSSAESVGGFLLW
jgi:hypothetical protein